MSAVTDSARILLRELKLNVRAWENALEIGIIPDRYRHEAVVRIRDGLAVISETECSSNDAPATQSKDTPQ